MKYFNTVNDLLKIMTLQGKVIWKMLENGISEEIMISIENYLYIVVNCFIDGDIKSYMAAYVEHQHNEDMLSDAYLYCTWEIEDEERDKRLKDWWDNIPEIKTELLHDMYKNEIYGQVENIVKKYIK